HATLLERLKAEGAAAAVFDIVFSDNTNPDADKHFAKSIEDFGKVFLAVDNVKVGYGRVGVGGQEFQLPAEVFQNANPSFGTPAMEPDDDYLIRSQTQLRVDDQIRPMS